MASPHRKKQKLTSPEEALTPVSLSHPEELNGGLGNPSLAHPAPALTPVYLSRLEAPSGALGNPSLAHTTPLEQGTQGSGHLVEAPSPAVPLRPPRGMSNLLNPREP